MIQTVVPNQDIPLITSYKVLGRPQLGYVLPSDIESYRIFVQLLQVFGDELWDIGWS